LFNLAGNFKSLTGSAVKLDWTSTNGSIPKLSQDAPVKTSNSPGITGRASARFAN
jgi:hypothetical protein